MFWSAKMHAYKMNCFGIIQDLSQDSEIKKLKNYEWIETQSTKLGKGVFIMTTIVQLSVSLSLAILYVTIRVCDSRPMNMFRMKMEQWQKPSSSHHTTSTQHNHDYADIRQIIQQFGSKTENITTSRMNGSSVRSIPNSRRLMAMFM